MLSCFYYGKCKTDLHKSYRNSFNKHLTYGETAIPTWSYSSTCHKDALAYYVS